MCCVKRAMFWVILNTDSGPVLAGIRTACSQLIEVLTEMGPSKAVDMDNATCRESLDVIGAPNRL